MNIAIIIAILLVLVGVSLWVSRIFMARAISSVIGTLREAGATTSATARTAEELNLRPRSKFREFHVVRDYRPYALQILMRSGVVELTEDGRLFLSEERLAMSRWSGE